MERGKHFLDLNKRHFVYDIGDVRIYGSWCGPEKRPCLALVPRFEIIGKQTMPFVVPVDHAYLWWERTADVEHIVTQSMKACECLGLDTNNPRNVVRVSILIQDHLQDLLSIPPLKSEKSVVADAVITDEYGKQRHSEILDDA